MKATYQWIYSLGLILALNNIGVAQEVLSSSGDSYQNSNTTIDFTLGEVVINTYAVGNLIITQGFHQSFQEVVSGLEPSTIAVDIQVYPNPSTSLLKVEVADYSENIQFKLYSIAGVLVQHGEFQKETEINISKNAKGLYQLILTNSNDQLIQTLKIQLK